MRTRIVTMMGMVLVGVMLCGCAKAGEPQVPFGVTTNQVLGMMPFGNRTYLASAKDGYHFLIVTVAEMKKAQKISASQMNQVVVDEKKTEFKPIAFGMPHVWGEPFMVLGYSFEGDIAADIGSTMLALYYLVPTSSSKFTLRTDKGQSLSLRVAPKWDAPKEMRVFGYKSFGKVNFGTPTVKEDGWGLKPAE